MGVAGWATAPVARVSSLVVGPARLTRAGRRPIESARLRLRHGWGSRRVRAPRTAWLGCLGLALVACGGVAPVPRPTARLTPSSPASRLLQANWPVYHHDPQRSGASLDTPAPGPLTIAWRASLDGAVWAQPLEVNGELIVATEGDSLYALDPADGAVAWRTHVGTPVPEADLPCGDIFPLGITGTPAYDPATDSIFAVAEELGPEHVLYALNPATGAVRWSRSVDIPIPSENPAAVQQRPALAIANGYVYIGFGGLDGDCSQYRGAVVGVPTTDQGPELRYIVPTSGEGGVWATGGPVLGPGNDLFVSTGNGAATAPPWDGSDSVLELSPSLHLLAAFAPTSWAADNAHDLDLGSVSPTLLPDGYLFIAGKSGVGYVLRQSSLGGVGGQVFQATVCGGGMAFGASAFASQSVYLPCASGVEAVAVTGSGHFAEQWQTSSGADGPPVLGGGCVWSVDTASGVLYALSRAQGTPVARISVGAVPHFTSPILLGAEAVVGTDSGAVAVSGA